MNFLRYNTPCDQLVIDPFMAISSGVLDGCVHIFHIDNGSTVGMSALCVCVRVRVYLTSLIFGFWAFPLVYISFRSVELVSSRFYPIHFPPWLDRPVEFGCRRDGLDLYLCMNAVFYLICVV